MYLKTITPRALTNTFITSRNYHFRSVVRTVQIDFPSDPLPLFSQATHSPGSGQGPSLTAGSRDLGMEIFMHKRSVSAESEQGEGGSETVTMRF